MSWAAHQVEGVEGEEAVLYCSMHASDTIQDAELVGAHKRRGVVKVWKGWPDAVKRLAGLFR